MRLSRLWQDTDFAILAALALIAVLLHTLTNGQYGFHRDELATLDDARYLAWGYIAYPGTGSVSWGWLIDWLSQKSGQVQAVSAGSVRRRLSGTKLKFRCRRRKRADLNPNREPRTAECSRSLHTNIHCRMAVSYPAPCRLAVGFAALPRAP
jgi:hypothetical protein